MVHRIKTTLTACIALLGIEDNTTSHREKLIATLGAGLGIAAVAGLTLGFLGDVAASLMIASMGASAVLLFAVPHGALSQPWAIVGGHLLSAAVGVTCQKVLGDSVLAPALAVGLAVALMCYARCIHPPGGATALAAAIGGSQVQELGYGFLLLPVGLNLAALMAAGLLFNNLFPWRRYPAILMASHKLGEHHAPVAGITHEDLSAAMESLDTYVDITSEELADLFERAWTHAQESRAEPVSIRGGGFYSNGHLGAQWSVRQIIDLPATHSSSGAELIYKNVAGCDAYQTGLCDLNEFRRWARFEVKKSGERWVKLASPVVNEDSAPAQ